MNFVGSATKLIDTDLPRLGSLIGVGEDELHAFLDVETNGGGFDAMKRPKMLFEPHKFYAHTSGTARARAISAGVAYATQGEKAYPSDSYPHLQLAVSIDEEAALKSASWGIGQVLGENYVVAGFDTVQEMVDRMVNGGEAAQLAAAIAFIKGNHLDDELLAHNWPAFARGYNGPNYAKFSYDKKLTAAFAKWHAIRDTPWPAPLHETLAAALNATTEDPVVLPAPAAAKPSAPIISSLGPVAADFAPKPPHAAVTTPPRKTWWQRFIAALTGKAA